MDVFANRALVEIALAANEQRHLDPDIVRPGWTALGIFLLLVVALALLLWSFARMSRKAREPWPGEELETDRADESSPTDDHSAH